MYTELSLLCNDSQFYFVIIFVSVNLLLFAGGRQSPDNFLLVLSSTWVSKGPSESYPDLYSLYVHKAITFSRGGMSYIEEYNPPRKTTYLVNYFTGPITSGQRNDGEEIEASH